MSITTNSSPTAGPQRGPRVRRSPMMLVIGIVMVVAGALISAGLYSHLGNTHEVLVVAAPVARGERIERADLASAQVGHDPLLTPIPADDLNQIVGQYAAADLVPGTFLVPAAVGERLDPKEGWAEIGISLIAGEFPDDDLRPGDQVILVGVADQPASPGTPETFPGTIATITATGSGGTLAASILVPADTAPRLAALSAEGRVALVLTARER